MTPFAYYLSFFASLGLLGIIAKVYPPSSRICRVLVWLLLTLFTGLRVGPGRDYFVYLNAYTDPLSSSAHYLEGTWTIFNYVCRDLLGMPFHLWLTLIAGTTYALFFWGLSRWKIDWVMGIIPFVLIHQGYFETMNIVRQCLAMSIVFVSLRDLYERCYMRFALGVLIATSLHGTAVVSLGLLPLALRRRTMTTLVGCLLVSLVIGQFFFYDLIEAITPLLPARYIFYIEGELLYTESSTGLLMILFNLIAGWLVYLLHQSKLSDDDPLLMPIQLVILSVCLYNALYIFGPGLRMMLYPFMAIFLVLPQMLRQMRSPMVQVSAGVMLLALSVLTIKDLSNPQEAYAHYQTIFDTTLPIELMDKYQNR